MMPMDQSAGQQPIRPTTRLVSYSANLEDVILDRIFRDRPLGVFVDIGAAHPKMENDCKALYDRGWRGINIEPNPSLHAELLRERPGDACLNLAVDEVAGQACYYQVEDTGLSTLDPVEAERCRTNGWTVTERTVSTRPLRDILAEAGFDRIDLLKVDVEGWEERVLLSNDWQRFRPDVILVEATLPERPVRRETGIAALLGRQGYGHAYFDGLNDFYVRDDAQIPDGCFATAPNVFDRYESYLLGEQRDHLAVATATAHALLADRDAALARAGGELAGLRAELDRAVHERDDARRDVVLRDRKLDDHEAALARTGEQLAELRAELDRTARQLGDVETKFGQALLERDGVRQDLALRDHELAFNADRNRSLQESIGRLQADCIGYADRLEATHAEHEELLRLRHHRDRLVVQEASVRAQLAEMGTTTQAKLNAQLDTQSVMAADIEAQQRQIEMLRRLYADSQAWLAEMRRSTSWQLTRPIRRIARLFRQPGV